MNFRTEALTEHQFNEILDSIANGFNTLYEGKAHYFRPNRQIATALYLQGNLGRRIGDILQLRLADFQSNGNGTYTLSIREQKTSKHFDCPVAPYLYNVIKSYAIETGKAGNDPLFDIKERVVQKVLSAVVEYLDTPEEPYKNISTHSFRKYAATQFNAATGGRIEYTCRFLNHSSPAVTMRYLRIDPAEYQTAAMQITQVCPF